MIVAATELLAANPTPSREEIREALAGNLCMCTGYVSIVRAVELAAARRRARTAPRRAGGRVAEPRVARRALGRRGRCRVKEDARLVAGRGRFIDDLAPPAHAPRRDAAKPARPRAHRRPSTRARRWRCPGSSPS